MQSACLKGAKTGPDDPETGLPKYPRKQTFPASVGMSQTRQYGSSRTFNVRSSCVHVRGVPDAALPRGFPRTFFDTEPKIARIHESQDGSRFWRRSRTGYGPTLALAVLGIASTSAGIGAAAYRGPLDKLFAGIGRSRPAFGTALQCSTGFEGRPRPLSRPAWSNDAESYVRGA